MRWKLCTLLAVLGLMVSTSSPVKVKAQGLVEYALILVLVAVGPGELGEIQWVPDSSQGKPQGPGPSTGGTVVFTYVVANTGDTTCTQTISSPVVAKAGLNSILVTRNDLFLVINGAEVGELNEECLKEPNRVSIAVGRKVPPNMVGQSALDTNTVPPGFPHLQVLESTIVDRITGKTITSASVADGFYILLAPLS
jgi:hypothetical protein